MNKTLIKPLINHLTVSIEDRQFFKQHGFIKLKNVFTNETINELQRLIAQSNGMKTPPQSYSGDMSRIGYDIEEKVTQNICNSDNFQNLIKQLTDDRGATFIQGIGFELTPNQTGFNWHHDIMSLCHVMPDDLAYTLWIPLDPINTKEQHGGLAYVSRQIYSAQHYFNLVYQLVKQDKFNAFVQTEDFKNWNFQTADPVENFILENNKVEDDFELGDALLFDKFVWHKSCTLKRGKLTSRRAYVMRFLDGKARYSNTLMEGTYSLYQATSNDLVTDVGYQLAKFLQEGEIISEKLINFKEQ
ncbi:MAG: hypothetical protein F6K62_18575 [Sphaerospermopsis sp. SIO1G2]|nr:hypothetical protein [Sphaerospermopsis sp. SIO1G1]NET72857.1 hypothetical protein [Sphaerospermopsis sp. SIO1G2]